MTGRHEVMEKPRRLRRKILGVPLGLWLVFAVAGVAMALFYTMGGFTGSVSEGVFKVDANFVAVVDGTCTASVASGDHNIDWQGLVEDEECVLDLNWKGAPTNTGNLRLQSFVLPAGLHVVSLTGCGATVTPGGTSAPATVLTIGYTPGFGTATFDPDLHGAKFVRSVDYVPGDCPPAP